MAAVRTFSYSGSRFQFDPATMFFQAEVNPRDSLQVRRPEEHVLVLGGGGVNFITLNIAHDCNMACPYCFAKQGMYGGPRELMGDQVAFKSVDWLIKESRKQKHVYLRFLGGEPFMNVPVMERTIHYASEQAEKAGKVMHFSVNTNGTIFNDRIARFMQDHKVTVSVSIDGDREAHNANRIFRNGQGTFDHAMRNLRKFVEIDPLTMINSTITSSSLDVADYAALYRESGVNLIRFALVGTADDKIGIRESAHIDRLCQQYDTLAQRYMDDIRAGDLWYLADFYKYFDVLVNMRGRSNRCGAGSSYVNIDVNGAIHLCHRFTADGHNKLGSIFDAVPGTSKSTQVEALPIVAEGTRKRSEVKHHYIDGMQMEASIEPQNVCGSCDIRQLCGGYCFHDSEMIYGEKNLGPDVAKCEVDRHLARIAMWLLQNMSTETINDIRRLHESSIQHVKG